MSLTKATYSMIEGAVINILDYGADPTGVADSTAAIAAAQAAACSGAIGLDGNTIIAENAVYFPSGTYKVTGLTYLGAPWIGDGMATTFIKLYGNNAICVNATGTNTARKLLSISDISFDGSNSTGASFCFRLGYNQRSFGALQRVRIYQFPHTAIYFAAPTWMMSFYDVYCSYNANGTSSLRTAICIDNTLGYAQVLAIDWYNLNLENNGFISSTVGGGIEISSDVAAKWSFYGGTWEGNYGIAEAAFRGITGVFVDGLYVESEAASCVHGILFSGCTASIENCRLACEVGQTGDAIHLINGAYVNVGQIWSNIAWRYDINATQNSVAIANGNGTPLRSTKFNVENGSAIQRVWFNRKGLIDRPTIDNCDAAQANSFYVEISDNRTMGAPSNPSVGQRILFTIIQGPTLGGHTLTWDAVFKVQSWSETGNTAGKRSLIEFEYNGTNWVQCSLQVPYF